MVDIEKLKKTIQDSGMTMVAVSQKSGITRETLYNRIKAVRINKFFLKQRFNKIKLRRPQWLKR